MTRSELSVVRTFALVLSFVAFAVLSSSAAFARQSAGCVAGANHLTSASSTTQFFTAFGNALSDPDPACPLCGVLVTADGTGMSQSQLNNLGANYLAVANDGVFGTISLSGTGVTTANLGQLLSRTCASATVNVNAAGWDQARIDVLANNILKIDSISGLPAGRTLTVSANGVSGVAVSGPGSVVLTAATVTGTANITTISSAITFPASLEVTSGAVLASYPEQVSGKTIVGDGTVSLVGAFAFDTDLTTITAGTSVDLDGVAGAEILASKTVTLTAAQASGKALSGAGTTAISGNIAANADFTAISSALSIPGSVNSGATLTITAAQGHNRSLAGAGSITIASQAIASNTNLRSLTTTGFAFSGSVDAGATLSVNAVQTGGCVVSGAGTVDVIGTVGADIVGGDIDAILVVSTDGGADTIATGDAGDTISAGDDNDSITAGAGNDSIDGGAGSDTANFASNLASATFSAPGTTFTISSTADGNDSVTGVETLVFADTTVYVVGSGGAYASLNAALAAAPAGSSFFGTLSIDSTTPFTDTASLNAILARCVGGSTYSVNVLSMNKAQLTAISANTATLGTITYPPVQVVNAGDPSGYFTTIQAGINFASAGDIVNVAAGTYAEAITISKALDVRGPNYTVSPNTGSRGAEAIIVPATSDPANLNVVTVSSSGVSFRGFTVDGDNTALAAAGATDPAFPTATIDASRGVFCSLNGLSNTLVQNNIVRNVVNGAIRLQQATNQFPTNSVASGTFANDNLVNDNLCQNCNIGVDVRQSGFAGVTNNTVTNARYGIYFGDCRIENRSASAYKVISGNTLAVREWGMWFNLYRATPYAVSNNTITAMPEASRTEWFGVMLANVAMLQNFTNQNLLPLVGTPQWFTFTNNTIDGSGVDAATTAYGYWGWALDNGRDTAGTDHFTEITGGSVSNVAYGISLRNVATSATGSGVDSAFGTATTGAHASISGVAFSPKSGGMGAYLLDSSAWVTGNPAPLVNKRNVQLSVGAGNSISGGATGMSVTRPATFAQPDYNPIVGGTVSNLAFSGQSGDYITLASPSAVDATSASFGGSTGAAATDSANFTIASKITDKLDSSALGRVTVKANNLFVTSANSVAAGIALVSAGEQVNVQAGAYADGAVTVNANNLTVNSEAGVSGYSFLLGTAANLSLAGAGDVNADGSAAANILAGSAGINTINGLAGADTISGGDAADTLSGGDDADSVSGNGGDDSVSGGNGNDTVSGNDGADSVSGNAGNDSLDGGAGADSVDGGTGVDSASYGVSYVGALSGSSTLSIDGDTVVNVENIVFSDATVAIVGRGGSEYAVLNDALSASGSTKLWGNLEFTSTTVGFTDTASLNAILARVVDGSTLTVNVLGMNKAQLAAVAANSASFPTLVYPPVQVVNAGDPSGYFTTIQAGINFASAGDTVNVAAGTYAEDLAISKAISLRGPNYGINPNTGSRLPEAIIVPATNNVASGKLIQAIATNISIDGFTLDGDNPAISGGTAIGTADSNCARAVRNQNAAGTGIPTTGLDLSNCVVKNFVTTGYYLEKFSATPIAASGNFVRNNLFTGMRFRAVYSQCDIVATGNVVTEAHTGIVVEQVGIAAAEGFTPVISDNTITLVHTGDTNRHMGICSNNRFGSAPLLDITNNTINGSASITQVGEAIRITTVTGGAKVHATNNVINGASTLSTGYWIWNTDSLSDVIVSGGSVSGVTANGVYLTDFDPRYAPGPSYMDGNFATIDGLAINASAGTIGINVNWAGIGSNLGPATATIRNSVSISGAGTGIAMNGAKARANFTGSAPASLDSSLATYISLLNAGATNPATDVDATAVSFAGATGATATDTQNFAIASKITDKLDAGTLARVSVKANNLFVNSSNSVASGVAMVSANETVNVQAGTYTDGAVTVNTAGLTMNSEAGVSGYSFTLGTADAVTLAGAGDVNATGNANANTLAGSAGINTLSGLAGADTITGGDAADAISGGADADTLSGNAGDDAINGDAGNDSIDGGAGADAIDGGAGVDSASYGVTYVGAISGSSTLSIDGDTVQNVENIVFSDATVAIVGRGGSEYAVLNDALSASGSTKLWGNLAFSSTTVGFTDTATLNAIIARIVDGSTVNVNYAGMSDAQIAAVNANLGTFGSFSGNPISITRGAASTLVGYAPTVQDGIDFATAGDVVNLSAGTYAEELYVYKALTLRGPNAAVVGNGTRAAEAIVQFPAGSPNGNVLVYADVDGVTFEGLDLRAQDSLITAAGSFHYIYYSYPLNNLAFRNNRMYGGEVAIYIDRNIPDPTPKSGLVISGNYIDCGPSVNSVYNRAMYITNSAGTIEDNTIVNANIGIQYMPYANPGAGVIQRNSVSAGLSALYHNYQGQGAAAVSWSDNTVTVAANDRTGLKALVDGAYTAAVSFRGMEIRNFGNADYGVGAAPSVTFTGNTVDASVGATGYNTAAREAVRFTSPYVSGSATFTSNSFTNWTVGVNAGFSASFEMSCNWWGTADANALAAAIPGTLRFSPFRTASTGTDCADGAVVLATKGRSYSTIQAAHDASATVAGDALVVAAGTYTENISISKRITLDGAGSGAGGTALVSAAGAATPVISVTGSGLDASNKLTIKDVSMVGTSDTSGSDGIAIYGDTPSAYVSVDNVNIATHGVGVHYRSGSISNVSVTNSTLSGNGFGVRVASAVASMDGMTIDGCTMNGNNSSAISTNPSGTTTNVNTNFTVSNSTFANNSTAGVANQHDISFFGFHGNATLSNVTMTSGNGAAANSNSYGIVFTNGSGRAALGTVSLSNVTVQGHVGKGALTFQLYNDVGGVSMSGVSLKGCVAPWGDLILDSTGATALNAGDTALKSVVLWNAGGVNATGASFYASTSASTAYDRAVLADNFSIANQVVDVVDSAGLGLVRTTAGKIYVSAASAAGFYRAIGAASAGDEIVVQDGAAIVLTTAITQSVTISGNFSITSANFPSDATATAVLSSFTSRLAAGSTLAVNLAGMNANQIAAVNANLAYFTSFSGNPVTISRGGSTVGYAPTVQSGIDYATAGDVVSVAAGAYAENITIAKALDVRGPNYTVSPNGGTRAAEAILVPASTNTSSGAVVTITSSGVSFRGFTVDGDNAALAASGVGLGGAYGTSIDAARCVFVNANGVNGITIAKNIAKNTVNGIRLEQTTNYFATTAGALRSYNILVDDNTVADTTGSGIRLGNSMYAKVTNNTVTNADNGVAFSSFRISDAGSAADRVIQGNTISARYAGIWVNLFHASPYALVNNTITVAAAATSMAPTPQNRTAWYGIMYSTVSAPQNFTNQVSLPLVATPEWWTATGNTIDGVALESTSTGHGYWLYYVDNNRDASGVDHFGQISGGSVSNVAYGIMLKNKDTDPATNFGNSAVGAHAAVSGTAFSLNAGGTGFRLIDDAAWVVGNPAPLLNKRNVQLSIGAGNSISGGATGISVTQPFTFAQPDYNPIVGGTVSDLAFSGQSGDYILLAMNKAVDATSATFGGSTGAAATDSANFAVASKITDAVDSTTLGLVRVKAANVFVNLANPVANGIAAAAAGDTVNLDAGTYTENISISKRITLDGAGSGAGGTALVSAAGAATPVISVTGSGLDASNKLTIKDVSMVGTSDTSGSDGIAIYGDTPSAYVSVDNVNIATHGVGVHYRSGSISNVSVTNSTLSGNGFGVRVASAVTSMDGMTIDGCTMNGNNSSAISTNPSGTTTNVNTNFVVSNSTFTGNGTSNLANMHDLSFFGFHGNAALSNVTVTAGNGTAKYGNGYGIVFTNGSGSAALGTVSLSNVTVQGFVGKGALTFQKYNDVSGVSMSGVSLKGCVAPWGDLIVDSTSATALNAGDTALKSVVLWNAGGVNATGAGFYSSTSASTAYDRAVLADNFSIANQVVDVVDSAGLGLVRTTAGKIYVSATAAAGALERAIGAASSGDEIVVQDGAAFVLTAAITKSVTFSGNFTVTASSIPTGSTATAILSSFASRLAPGSTFSANIAGMTQAQVAAVNAVYASLTSPVTGANVSIVRGTTTVGSYLVIQQAIDAAVAADRLDIVAGTFAEALNVSKSLTFRGPNAGKSGTDATRGAEAVIMSPAGMVASYGDTAYIVTVPEGVDGVVFDGLMVNGDNPATTSPFTANGANPDADEGFSILGDGAIVRNCVIKNVFQFGITMGATGTAAARFGEVTDNYIENIPYWAAILAWDSYYAKIEGNTVVNAWRGVQTNNHYLAVPAGKTASISNNTITSAIVDIAGDATYDDYDGILHNLQYGASSWTIANNTITSTSASNTGGDCDGIEVWSIQTGATVSITGNTISGFPNGYTLWHCPATAGVTVSGGSVSGAINGVVATNRDNYGNADSSSYTVSGVSISGCSNGVLVNDSALNTNGSTVSVALSGGSISGGATGLRVSGADSSATVATTAFSGQSGDYIALVSNASAIDATSATFGGSTGASASRSANFAIASKITDKGDNSALGRVTVKAANVFVNSGASVALGLGAAAANDTVNVEAGTYLDGAVTVNTTGLTIDADAGVSGFSFTLGTANSLVLAGAGDMSVLGNASANSVTANAGVNSIDGAAGIDTAVFSGNAPTSLAAGSSISVGSDTVTRVEKLVFSDATIVLVGTGGSEYLTLNATLAATTTERLFGTLAIDSSTFATAAELDAITARFVGGSTVTVDVLGMNATQLAAVAGNATASGAVVYPPVQVVSGATVTGYFTTITNGISFAQAGDVINVAAGTYTEQFTINKAVTVQGPNADVAGNGTRAAEAVLDYSGAATASQFVLVSQGSLKGFMIVDNYLATSTVARVCVVDAAGNVSNCLFSRDSGYSAPAGDPQRLSSFTAISVVQSAGSSASVSGNYFTGSSAAAASAQRSWSHAIRASGNGGSASLTGNVFDYARFPMTVGDDLSALTIDANTFNGVGVDEITVSSATATSLVLGTNDFNNPGKIMVLASVPVGFEANIASSHYNGSRISGLDLSGQFVVAAACTQSITDSTKNGLVRSKSGNVYVPATTAALAGGISRAISVASVGDTVNVAAGTFVGNVNVGKRIALVGAGATTIVSSNTASTPVITISGSGASATDRLVVSNLRATGGTGGSNSGSGIYVSGSGAISNLTLDGVTVSGNTGFGIAFNNTFATSDVKILNSTVTSNTDAGIRIATATPSFTDLLVDGCTVSSNGTFGFVSNPSQSNTVVNSGFTIQNSTFSGNNTLLGANNHDMFFGSFRGAATISNVDITANQRAHGIVFNGWGNATAAQWQPAGNIVLNDVVFNGTIDKTCTYFYRYSTLANVSMTDVDMSAVTTLPTWHQLSADCLGALNAGNTKLKSISSGGCAVDARNVSFYGSGGAIDKSSLANLYRIEDAIRHQVDTGIVGLVRVNTSSVYLSKNSGTLENAIAAASAGDVVYVEDGTAWTLVNEITKSITFSGNFVVTAANIPSGSTADAVLNSFVTRGASGATFSAVTSGMSADQLSAVGNNYAYFNGGVTGSIALTSAQSVAQINAILAGAPVDSAYADATGMSSAQLNALASNATKLASDGVTGTMLVTSGSTDSTLSALLAKTSAAATVNVDGTSMTATALSAVASNDSKIDEISNLSLADAQSASEITTLLGKSVAAASTGKAMAVADATSMDAAKLNALGASYAKLGADGITGSVSLVAAVTDANMTNLFAKIASAATVRADGTGMGASTLAILSSNIAKVDSAFAIALTSGSTATVIANVLGVSDAASATADATGMDSNVAGQLAKLADNYLKIANNGITGAIVFNANLTPTQITNLLSKANLTGSSFVGGTTVTINASGMTDAQLSALAAAVASAGTTANQAAVFDVSNLSLGASQTSSELATLLNVTTPNGASVNATGMSSSQLAELGNYPAAVDQITGSITITADLTAAQIAAIMGNTSTSAVVTIDSNGMSPAQQAAVLSNALMVVNADATVPVNSTFIVNIDVSGLSTAGVGVQARVNYDASKLEFVSDFDGDGYPDSVGGTAMPTTVFATPGAGYVSFATGVDIGGDGTGITTGNVAQLRFRALAPVCDVTNLLSLATSGFTNRITSSSATAIPFIGTNFTNVTAMNNLALTGVPSSSWDLPADAGTTDGAAVSAPTVTSTDSCGNAVTVVRTITLAGVPGTTSSWPARFPVGLSSITWTATDPAGNIATATRTVTVQNYQLATVDVNLVGGVSNLISWNQTVRVRMSSGDVVSAVVPFTGNNGAVTDVQVPVRSDYTCMSIKDAVHTVAKSQAISVSGTKYVAAGSFDLIGGDSNDDNLVDIFDFGLFVNDRGAGKNPNSRSNFDRNLFVNNSDFSYISLNFTVVGDTCGGGFFAGNEPRTRVSVKELRRLGLGELVEADINMDGWLDVADIELALQGRYRPDFEQRLDPADEVEVNW